MGKVGGRKPLLSDHFLLIFKDLDILCTCIFCLNVMSVCYLVPEKARRSRGFLGSGVTYVCELLCVLGISPRSCGRSSSAFNCCDIFPAAIQKY